MTNNNETLASDIPHSGAAVALQIGVILVAPFVVAMLISRLLF
jgi:hypothetical protein